MASSIQTCKAFKVLIAVTGRILRSSCDYWSEILPSLLEHHFWSGLIDPSTSFSWLLLPSLELVCSTSTSDLKDLKKATASVMTASMEIRVNIQASSYAIQMYFLYFLKKTQPPYTLKVHLPHQCIFQHSSLCELMLNSYQFICTPTSK